ncbi:multicopper oxidase family protein [Actinacidiphila acidipaludis]|uniref:Multicopper oxidase CueO n=1 Tax=Actinacidiphila acidipaludis TaxID=2873382 RepID=A0ABS7Q7H6_9ACTN|nr:multicopper oxidase domain-containing protein [Streptomyces acidipaludis]MBY8879087.1 multicopper oxidase domain-containing protein [Streptomyces acidipaludis]
MTGKHSRRRFLSMATGTMAGVAVTSAAFYSATELMRANAAENGGFDGVSSPQYTDLTPFKDKLRQPPTLAPKHDGITEMEMVNQTVRLHSQLPPVPMWTYAGHFPGPTIEARRGERLRFAWTNKLRGTLPVKAVYVAPDGPPPGLHPYNVAGSGGAAERPDMAALTPWTAVHLHGGYQHAISDGQPDDAVTPGSSQLTEYTNEKAAHLFYHDHAMPVTGPNVLSGLAGSYLVRDEREDALGLPKDDYEVTLSLADINFEKDAQGRLEGRILYKRIAAAPASSPDANPPTLAFEGPFTIVNGVVWPYMDVEARAYRFRMVNNSLTRQFILALLDEATGKPLPGAVTVIGTDGGLLGEPQPAGETISLMPAERVDVVIDFSVFAGKRLRFVNTIPGVPAGSPVPDAGVGRPEVMQFRVGRNAAPKYRVPRKLSAAFRPLTAKDVPADAVERFVGLIVDKFGMPALQELQEVASGTKTGPGIVQLELDGKLRTFRGVANYFEDRTNFYAASGGFEVWTFLNAGPIPIPHPIHIHLIDFQLLQRNALKGTIDTATQSTAQPLTLGAAQPIAPEESGWKDTVLVPGNSMVRVAGRFGAQTGRFMYHCHLLDHEDDGMMRPVVIMPPAVLTVQKRQMALMGSSTGMSDDMPGMKM